MAFEIRRQNHITPEQENRIHGWSDTIYGSFDGFAFREKDEHLLGYADGVLVSHAGLLTQTVDVAGQQFAVGGVGSVVTVPEAQGKGYATAILATLPDEFRNRMRVDFGMLFCRDALVPFYVRLGWRAMTDPVTVQQPDGERVVPFNIMVLPARSSAWPAGPVHIPSLPW